MTRAKKGATMAYENRIECTAETPADLTFGPGQGHFWITVGPKYQSAMTIRVHGRWAESLHEALGEYLKKGNQLGDDPRDSEFAHHDED